MRSLHVITSTARRGAETFAVELATELRRAGDAAQVVALTGEDDPAAHDVVVLGVSRRSPAILTGLRSSARRADVVVAHGSATLEACAVALAGSSTPFVYRTIGDPSYWVTTLARRTALGFLHRRAARHVALWQGAADQLADRYGLSPDRIDVIPNAVPGARWRRASVSDSLAARSRFDVPEGWACLAFVGALSPEKDVAAVLEVARAIPQAVVLITGTGPQRARLEAAAAQIDRARIRFLGPLPDPWPVYAAADLLLLPSLSEGMPGVIIEAGLVGTASVATRVGAVPELIIDGRTGFLSQVGDHARFADVVKAALPVAKAAGTRAATGIRRSFTIEAVAPRWSEVLARACGR
jgi:glycosyltransferase involved in cell wall biosynthesis